MTDENDARPVSARTRAEDGGRLARFRAWWQKWKDPIVGAAALTASLGCLVLAVLVYNLNAARASDARVVRVIAQEQAKNTKATAAAAKVSCLRSRRLGPLLADYYALDPAFPRDVLAEYRRTIPKSCPK